MDLKILALVERKQRHRSAFTYSLDKDIGHFNHMGYLGDKFKNHYFINENGYIQDFQDFIAEGPGVQVTSQEEQKLKDIHYFHYRSKERGKVKVSDIVRISHLKGVFEKGYLPNWS